MNQERRQSRRVPYPCEVRCTLADGMEIANTRLSDVSTAGAFVESMNEIPIGTTLRLAFAVGNRTIDVAGHVVQQMAQFGFGVQFDEIQAEDRAALGQLVAQAG
jgi:hypothetical protein